MIWVAALDPASLTLWYDTSILEGSGSKDERIVNALHHSVLGKRGQLFKLLGSINDGETLSRCIHLVSTVWHEQRHFVDMVLTNYGAFRFRQFLSVYYSHQFVIDFALSQSIPEIVFPVDIYADEVRCRSMNIDYPVPESVQDIVREMWGRERLLAFDRKRVRGQDGRSWEIGGNAQLEALANIFQLAGVQYYFGRSRLSGVYHRMLKNETYVQRYLWPVRYSQELGLNSQEGLEGQTSAMLGNVSPFLIATLSMRAWGQYAEPNELGGVANTPTGRLAKFIRHFRERPGCLKGLSILEVWQAVNEIAERIFGRTVLEEIKVDLDHERNWLEEIRQNDSVLGPVKHVYTQYHWLRTSLYEMLESSPESLIHPREYSAKLLPIVRPIPVYFRAVGAYDEPPLGWQSVAVSEQSPKLKWWWMSMPQEWSNHDGTLVAFPELLPWVSIVVLYAPLAKLMMKGRSHRTMIGPEIMMMEEELKDMGLLVRFEKEFEYPHNHSIPADSLYEIRGTDTARCDLCGKLLMKPEGHTISPWAFRSSPNLLNYVIDTPPSSIGRWESRMQRKERWEKMMRRDWSAWIVCDCCHDSLATAQAI